MKDLGFLRYQSEPIGKHDYRHVRLLDSSIMKKGLCPVAGTVTGFNIAVV